MRAIIGFKDTHMTLRERDSGMHVGRITCDDVIVFNEVDEEYMRRCIIRMHCQRATFAEYVHR